MDTIVEIIGYLYDLLAWDGTTSIAFTAPIARNDLIFRDIYNKLNNPCEFISNAKKQHEQTIIYILIKLHILNSQN